jgi:hypothetical protein
MYRVGGYYTPSALTAGPGLTVTNVQGGTLGLENGVAPTKTGEACSKEILGLFASGDNRVETAMANGGITQLVYVQHTPKNHALGAYAQVCTIARGN